MPTNSVIAYKGMMEIENGAFDLEARLLVVRDNEIAFDLIGSDEYGIFRIEGKALLTSLSNFISEPVKVEYLKYPKPKHTATIQFDVVELTMKQQRCFITGQWRLPDETFGFAANLTKIR